MKFKIINEKINDSFEFEADTLIVARMISTEQLRVRGWEADDCHSVQVPE